MVHTKVAVNYQCELDKHHFYRKISATDLVQSLKAEIPHGTTVFTIL